MNTGCPDCGRTLVEGACPGCENDSQAPQTAREAFFASRKAAPKQIVNRHPGTCRHCGTSVSPEAGFAQLDAPGAGWNVICTPCEAGETPTPGHAHPPIATRPTFPLTEEQQAAVALFLEGRSIAVQAGAGVGKTTVLVAMAKATDRIGQYVAFNTAIVRDSAAKMPRNVSASTAHSLAFRQVGKLYKHRLDGARQTSADIARRLDLGPFYYQLGEERKVMQPATLAGHAMKAISNFCNSADKAPTTEHLAYIDGVELSDAAGHRAYTVNNAIRAHCADAITTAWADIVRTDGQLRFTHSHYMKIWELGLHGKPIIPGDFLLVDEAQDLAPVLLSVIEQQSSQTVFVGDENQSIMEWAGAIDAMKKVPADATTYLTTSWRFGQGIADAANRILEKLPTQLRMAGRGPESTIGYCSEPDAILCRTNAGAIDEVLSAAQGGKRAHLVGGGGDVERFAKAAGELIAGRTTDHPELACFSSWDSVQTYVAFDPSGTDLALMVRLIDNYGVDAIIEAVSNTVSEQDADVVVSTSHRSKGREWDSVKISSDFPDRTDDAELRLLYVACTRAKRHLDITACESALAIVKPQQSQREAPSAPGGRAPVESGRGTPVPTSEPVGHTAKSVPLSGAVAAPPAIRSEPAEPAWWIGRCQTNCKHAAKLFGVKRFDGAKFLGFFGADGERIHLPECTDHHKRPFMKLLQVKPPEANGRCNSQCWGAMKDECNCPCQGTNHGSGHAPAEMIEAQADAEALA